MCFQLTLHSDNEATLALDHLGNHVVNQAVFIPNTLGFKILLVIRLIDGLEDILEPAIVLLQDGVLGAHVQWEILQERHLEAGVREAADRVVSVVLGLRYTAAMFKIENLELLRLSILVCVYNLKPSRARNHLVGRAVLVTKGMSADDDWFLPARDEPRNAVNDDWLTEHRSTTDCNTSVGCRMPGKKEEVHTVYF